MTWGMHVGKTRPEVFDRSYVPVTETGCWLWTSNVNKAGYGYFKVNAKRMLAHRYSWSMINGEIPSGMVILHKCDTPACVNPEHLILGTIADNNADKTRKGRQSRGSKHSMACCNQSSGENHFRSIMTWDLVDEIRNSTITNKSELARIYGVSHGCITSILKFRTWKVKNVSNTNT